MSAILRWFHDGEVRYHAYFRTLEPSPQGRQLIVASRTGDAIDIALQQDRDLDDFSESELLGYARLLGGSGPRLDDAAAD